jgi:2-methylcitrate dehydratase PrpD
MEREPTLTQALAAFVTNLEWDQVPEAVKTDAVRRVVDAVGVGLAGSTSPYASMVLEVAAEYGGRDQATAWGSGRKLPAPLAAMVNAALVHGHDFDDMHSRAMVHISCVTVPAAIALAEQRGASGAECLLALVAGAEVGLRLGDAAPHRFILRGWHGTSVCGTFAAATVAAKLMRLDAERTAHALGLAASQSSGIMQGLHDGSWVKRVHPGWAVHNGIMAASLAARGFTGPMEALEGTAGLYRVFLPGDADEIHLEDVVAGLGKRWLLPETSYKKYPTGAWTQAAMDGVTLLLDEAHAGFADIDRIDCALPPDALPVVCEPREEKIRPATAYQAKFSLPHSVAMMAVLGHGTIDAYDEGLVANADIRAVAERVHCHADPSMAAPGFPVVMELRTRDGRTLRAGPLTQPGSPENPLSDAQHAAKFMDCAGRPLGDARTEALLDWLRRLASAPDLAGLRQLVTAA